MKKRFYDHSYFERIYPQGAVYEIKLITKRTEVNEITFVFHGDILGLVERIEQLKYVKRLNTYRLSYLDDEVVIDINSACITDKGVYSGFTSAHVAYLFIKDFFEFVSARIPTKNNTSTNEPSIIKTPDEVTFKLSTEQKDSVNDSVDTKSDKRSYIIRMEFTTSGCVCFLVDCVCKVNANFDDIRECLLYYAPGVANFKFSLPKFDLSIDIISLERARTKYKDTDFYELEIDNFDKLIEFCLSPTREIRDIYSLLLSANDNVDILKSFQQQMNN